MRCVYSDHAYICLSLLLVLCLNFVGASGEKKCYYPDNTLAPSDSDCNPGEDASVCCGKGYVCLRNGVCQIDPSTTGENAEFRGTIWRGSCTDQSWSSARCPNFCTLLGTNLGNSSSGQQLGKCPDMEDTYYCKTSDVEYDCKDGSKVFQIRGESLPMTTIPLSLSKDATPTTTITLRPLPTSIDDSTTVLTIIPSILPALTTWVTHTSVVLPEPTPTNTSGMNTTIPTEAASVLDNPSYASRHAVSIGIGVSASVGLLALGLIAFFLIRRHRKESMELLEVYRGPWPPINSALHDYSPVDRRRISSLPRGRAVRRSHLESLRGHLEPMFLPPIQSPLPLSPIFVPLTPVDLVGQAL